MTNNQKSWIKSTQEIKLMKKSGEICAKALKEVIANVKPGVKCSELDSIAKEQIEKLHAKPSFTTIDDYQWTICTTINDEVVHGIPSNRKLESGDILGIDIGAVYEGYHSDMAISLGVGEIKKEDKEFLRIGTLTLKKAISQAKDGNNIGDISAAIQENIERAGFSVVKNLTGHGIGRELHEEPYVPGFGEKGTGPKIKKNMVLAIEVIYAKGSPDVKMLSDNWTISTNDGSLGGLFEQTVAIGENGPIVLTPYA